jgi:hypothetical protein
LDWLILSRVVVRLFCAACKAARSWGQVVVQALYAVCAAVTAASDWLRVREFCWPVIFLFATAWL